MSATVVKSHLDADKVLAHIAEQELAIERQRAVVDAFHQAYDDAERNLIDDERRLVEFRKVALEVAE